MYSVKSLGRHWNEARSIFLDWIKTLRFGMCKSFSGFMQRGKVLASLITNMDKKLVVATKWYFVNFAFSSYPSSGGYTWESRSLFLLAKHTVEKDSAYIEARLNISGCSCCDRSFRPALTAGDLLEQLLVLSCEL